MIPLPTAIDNHQFENAKSIVELGMGEIHIQNESIEKLICKIENIISYLSYLLLNYVILTEIGILLGLPWESSRVWTK